MRQSPRDVVRSTPGNDGGQTIWSFGEAYEAVNPQEAVPLLAKCLKRHAIIAWLILPAWATLQAFVLHPTRENGYSNVALILLVAVEGHHVVTEMQAWSLTKQLCLPKELLVMRQLGVLRRRPKLVPLGILEVLDLYTDLVFPCFVSTCEPGVTEQWIRSWRVVPGVGHVLSRIVSVLQFWRVATFFVIAMLVMALLFLWNLVAQERPDAEQSTEQETARVSADDFLFLARYANTAMMPSVERLCEEMADQRRWVFDSSKDAKSRLELYNDFKAGWKDGEAALRAELMNQDQEDKLQHAAKFHFTCLLLLRVIIGNVIQIWLQGAFFSLSYTQIGHQACAKLIISVFFSTSIACLRCKLAAGHIGILAYVVALLVVLFAAFTGWRMYRTYACADHLWNLTTGCVRTPES